MDKKAVRRQMLQMRDALPPQFVEKTAMVTGGYIASIDVFQKVETIMLYSDFRNETGTGPLLSFCLKKGKNVVLPLTDSAFLIHPFYVNSEADLSVSKMGIREPDPAKCRPCAPEDIDLLISPGVAFDVFGHRLGYGKGCYDRFLPQLRPDVPIIGLAYDFQVLPSVPAEPHDRLMDAIITEKGLLTVPKAKNPVK